MIPAFYNPLSSADGGGMIVAGLHEDIVDGAILIDGAPQVVDGAIDGEEHLVKMPRIVRTRSVAAQTIRYPWQNLWHHWRMVSSVPNIPCSQQFCHVAIAEGKTAVQPRPSCAACVASRSLRRRRTATSVTPT